MVKQVYKNQNIIKTIKIQNNKYNDNKMLKELITHEHANKIT
jgi:hypothetical protein